MSTLDEKIAHLIKQDFGMASILHFYGIDFSKHTEVTLGEICQMHQINPEVILDKTKEDQKEVVLNCKSWPIENIIRYLQFSHQIFIKHKLPFIGKLISEMQESPQLTPLIIKDLKMIFPVFSEDFIKHIYDEEDTLFTYINYLIKATVSISNPSEVYLKIHKNGIQKFNLAHDSHDDEMAGIRILTDNYFIDADADLCTFVIYQELQAFEKELKKHAFIENQILFPKALKLENEVKWRLAQMVKLN